MVVISTFSIHQLLETKHELNVCYPINIMNFNKLRHLFTLMSCKVKKSFSICKFHPIETKSSLG